MKTVILFAGAGGSSEAARQAGCDVVWVANHNPKAVAIHKLNHPEAIHVCQDLHQTNFAMLPQHDMLIATWCCQGNSPARGKAYNNPEHDESRSTAWAVITALEFGRPHKFVGENVKGFLKWTLFPAWCMAVEALGYALDFIITDAADHGVPQHRERLFIIGVRAKHPVMIKLEKRPHVPARSFIDFNVGSWSPISEKVEATRARVANGRKRFGERFIFPYYKSGSGLTGRSLDRPIGTITTLDRWGVVDGDMMRMMSKWEARDGMGFPRSYILPDDHRSAMHFLGDAVAPPQMRDVILSLKEAA